MCLLPWEITTTTACPPSVYSGYFPSHPQGSHRARIHSEVHLDRVHQRVPSWHQSRWCSASLFQFILSTSVLLTVYLVPYFPHLCAFCWWFCPLKWPNIVLESCSVFLSTRRLQRASQRKYESDKLHSGLSYSAVGCECSVTESTVLYIQEKKKRFTYLYVSLLQKRLK